MTTMPMGVAVLSSHSHAHVPHLSYFSTSAAPLPSCFILHGGLWRNPRSSNISCCKNTDSHRNPRGRTCEQSQSATTRRQLVLYPILAAIPFSAMTSNSVALAENEDDFRLYSDDADKFTILIPQDWQVGRGEGDGIKSLIAFYPPDASTSNVSIVITGLGADFTRLESFGKVDAFAESLVGGLDRSWQRPPGVAAKLVDSKAANGLYYIEYTLRNPGESQRHLFSVLGIANNGWYNRLYTLTGQFVEEEADTYGSKIEKVVASFRLI